MISSLLRKRFDPLLIVGLVWPLALLAPFIPGIARPALSGLPWRQELVMAVLLACTLSALIFRRSLERPFSVSRREAFLILSLLLFTLWSGLSIFWAKNPYPALHHTFVWGIYLLFFILMRRVAESPRLLSASLAVFCAITFIISLACVIGGLGASLSLFRNNGLGEPLAVSIPLLATLALHLKRKRLALLCGATAALAWLAMLQAHERTPFLSSIAGLSLLLTITLAIKRFRPRTLMRVPLLLGALALAAALQFMPSLTSKFAAEPPFTVYSRLKSTSASDENTLARLLYWNVAIEMARERPLTGVGASHYGIDFAEARARFAATRPVSQLSGMLEWHLAVVAHNEYLQILAELGITGFLFFLLFAVALMLAAWLALRRSASPLVPGAISALAIFAINSGASSVSFRWLGSGLIFFFAAAIISRLASAQTKGERVVHPSPLLISGARAVAFAFSILVLCGMSVQALSVVRSGQAQAASDAKSTEKLFNSALFWNPLDGATRFTYGQWLYQQGRHGEAIPHLRYGTDNGVNTSLCYAYLSSAQVKAGAASEAEATLREALKVYPRSVFLNVRLARLLAVQGKESEADEALARAVSIDEASARAWWVLTISGKEAATRAAIENPGRVASPGALWHEAVFFVLSENEEPALSFAQNDVDRGFREAGR